MIPTAAAQHRVKHFDLLLTRELAYIKREHEQNIIIHKNLENSILRDKNQISTTHRKKLLIQNDQIYNGKNEKSHLSFTSNHNIQNPIDETRSRILPQYHRLCFKGQRLPPIIKLNRQKRKNNDFNRLTNRHQIEDVDETFTSFTEELPKAPLLPELTPIQKQIQSFMETLPPYKGVQKGFDNFAPASRYSNRAPVAMR